MKAEPALLAAQEALNTLNKNNLTELKSFGSPPGAVTNVTSAVMVLMATNGKIPKDRSWKQAKMMMAKVDAFLDALINYDKEHIHSDVIKVIFHLKKTRHSSSELISFMVLQAIQPYLNDSEFDPDFVRTKSGAAAGLCAWVCRLL